MWEAMPFAGHPDEEGCSEEAIPLEALRAEAGVEAPPSSFAVEALGEAQKRA